VGKCSGCRCVTERSQRTHAFDEENSIKCCHAYEKRQQKLAISRTGLKSDGQVLLGVGRPTELDMVAKRVAPRKHKGNVRREEQLKQSVFSRSTTPTSDSNKPVFRADHRRTYHFTIGKCRFENVFGKINIPHESTVS